MKYTEFSDMLQKKVNDLPIIYAFSNEQLDRALDDMGLSQVTKAAYHDARGDFLRIADERDWY